MRHATLATVATVLLTATACGGADPETVDGATDDESESSEEVIVPVERSTDLLDPEGSELGTAWLRESDSDVPELEVQVAGLTEGFHGMYLLEADNCDALTEGASGVPLSPMLVLGNGVGSVTSLIGEVDLEELLDGGGVTVVIGPAVAAPNEVLPEPTASRVACGTFGDGG